ncbi:type I restriction enzyme, S subunit [Ruegeria intermedia]|uniref:Type I restriction enzyme, S subunit n=1 Tax=Ruegeria intermedia TaxID=996115 RepID=A0A1M4Y882_9RHOB|nr:restriction endonuclease subunit S [Ruegeria intermedia]SHF01890.1 type I restriction enzyme, S subunit [Ruegeria intermedia]
MREGWRDVRLGELGVLLKGKGISRADLASDGVPCLRYGEIYSTYGSVTEHLVSRVENSRSNDALQLLPGDIVLAASGETAEEIGKAVAYIGRKPGRVGGDTIVIRDHGQDPIFLGNLLNSPNVVRQKARLGKGQSVVHIHAPDIADILVHLPPLPEQRKIAEILRTWDEALEKLTALRAAKVQRLEGIAQQLLAPSRAIGRGVPQSNWAPSSFGEVFEERQDKNAGLSSDDVVTVGKYAIRKQSEHFTRSVASKDLSNYWTISPGDFVYDPMSAYYGAIGRYAGSADGIVSPAYRVIKLSPDVDPEFMVALLRTHHIRFLLETRSSQGNKEGKRRLLQRNEFERIEFKLPPREAQREIATKLAVFSRDLKLTELEIDALTRQKRGLMQKLLTGEWRVQLDSTDDRSPKKEAQHAK